MAIVIRQKYLSFCASMLNSLRCGEVLFLGGACCAHPRTKNRRGVDWDMLKHYA